MPVYWNLHFGHIAIVSLRALLVVPAKNLALRTAQVKGVDSLLPWLGAGQRAKTTALDGVQAKEIGWGVAKHFQLNIQGCFVFVL